MLDRRGRHRISGGGGHRGRDRIDALGRGGEGAIWAPASPPRTSATGRPEAVEPCRTGQPDRRTGARRARQGPAPAAGAPAPRVPSPACARRRDPAAVRRGAVRSGSGSAGGWSARAQAGRAAPPPEGAPAAATAPAAGRAPGYPGRAHRQREGRHRGGAAPTGQPPNAAPAAVPQPASRSPDRTGAPRGAPPTRAGPAAARAGARPGRAGPGAARREARSPVPAEGPPRAAVAGCAGCCARPPRRWGRPRAAGARRCPGAEGSVAGRGRVRRRRRSRDAAAARDCRYAPGAPGFTRQPAHREHDGRQRREDDGENDNILDDGGAVRAEHELQPSQSYALVRSGRRGCVPARLHPYHAGGAAGQTTLRVR